MDWLNMALPKCFDSNHSFVHTLLDPFAGLGTLYTIVIHSLHFGTSMSEYITRYCQRTALVHCHMTARHSTDDTFKPGSFHYNTIMVFDTSLAWKIALTVPAL